MGPLADDLHLAEDTGRLGDDDIDVRGAHILRELHLDVVSELARGLAHRRHVLIERSGDLAVRPHRHRDAEVGIAPDEYLQHVPRADDVVRSGRRGPAGLRDSRAANHPEEGGEDTGHGLCALHVDASYRPARRARSLLWYRRSPRGAGYCP